MKLVISESQNGVANPNPKGDIIKKGFALSLFFKQKDPVFALTSGSPVKPVESLSKNPNEILSQNNQSIPNQNQTSNSAESKNTNKLAQITKDNVLSKSSLPSNIAPGSTEAKLFLINLNTVSENSKALEIIGKKQSREKANELLKDFQKLNLASHFKSKSLNMKGFNDSEVNTFNFNRNIQQKQAKSRIQSQSQSLIEREKELFKILSKCDHKEILTQVENDIAQFVKKELDLKREQKELEIKQMNSSYTTNQRGTVLFDLLMKQNLSLNPKKNSNVNPFLNISNSLASPVMSFTNLNILRNSIGQQGNNPHKDSSSFDLLHSATTTSFFSPNLSFRFPEIQMLEKGAHDLFVKEQESEIKSPQKSSTAMTSISSKRQSQTLQSSENKTTSQNEYENNFNSSTKEQMNNQKSKKKLNNLFSFKTLDLKAQKQQLLFQNKSTQQLNVPVESYQQESQNSLDSFEVKKIKNNVFISHNENIKDMKSKKDEFGSFSQIISLKQIKLPQKQYLNVSVNNQIVNTIPDSSEQFKVSSNKENSIASPLPNQDFGTSRKSVKDQLKNSLSLDVIKLQNRGSFQICSSLKPFRINQQAEGYKPIRSLQQNNQDLLHESRDNDNSGSFASFTEIKLDQLYKHSTKLKNQLHFIDQQFAKVKRFDITKKLEAQKQRSLKELSSAQQFFGKREIQSTFNRKFKHETKKIIVNEDNI